METRILTNIGQPFMLPNGQPAANANIQFTLVHNTGVATDVFDAISYERIAPGPITTQTNLSGVFSVALWPTSRGNMTCFYLCHVAIPGVSDIVAVLPDGGAELDWLTFSIGGTPPTPAILDALAIHIGLANPHTGADIIVGGPWIDSRLYSTLALADAAAVAVGKQLLIAQPYTANTMTLSSNVKIIPGGSISVNSGQTVTFTGALEAGLYQIFTGAGIVQFNPGATILPEWWGAYNNKTNATATGAALLTTFQTAVRCNLIMMLTGQYLTDRSLTSQGVKTGHNHKWRVTGQGLSSQIINAAPSSNPTFNISETAGSNEPYGWEMDHFSIFGQSGYPNKGIQTQNTHNFKVHDMHISANGSSMFVQGSIYPTIYNISSWLQDEATGTPFDYMFYFLGTTDYPVNDLVMDNIKASPPAYAGMKMIFFQNQGSAVGTSHFLSNIDLESSGTGTNSMSGIFYDAPTSGNWENINIKNLHIEGVASNDSHTASPAVTGYAVFMNNVRQCSIKNVYGGEADPTVTNGQMVRIDNSVNVSVDNAKVLNFLATSGNVGVGITNSTVYGVLSNLSQFPIGQSALYPYAAGSFTSDSGTWTVSSGNASGMTYTMAGNTMTLNINIAATSVTGTPRYLYIAIPNGYQAASSVVAIGTAVNAGATAIPVLIQSTSGVAAIAITNNITGAASPTWTAASGTTYITGQITVPLIKNY